MVARKDLDSGPRPRIRFTQSGSRERVNRALRSAHHTSLHVFTSGLQEGQFFLVDDVFTYACRVRVRVVNDTEHQE